MGDKKGKKEQAKGQRQKDAKQAEAVQQKKDKQQPKVAVALNPAGKGGKGKH